MTMNNKEIIINHLVELLEIPEKAYEKAISRYEDIGEWLSKKSEIRHHMPQIFSQGSFRLGTAIRPLDNSQEYDLDLGCKLNNGISFDSHTQNDLKELVGEELEKYRLTRGIESELASKHRCWRLEYKDDLSFHIDIVPCIPAGISSKSKLNESMKSFGIDTLYAKVISDKTILITDDRKSNYNLISENWEISNPEGYALWFEERMKSADVIRMSESSIEDIPLYKRKAPLQKAIQILKRHRDNWSKNNQEAKPISIIITTLSAQAYGGEGSVSDTLQKIISQMENFIQDENPKIPNPVNPNEDFADKWYTEEGRKLHLEENFYLWLNQAKRDLDALLLLDNDEKIDDHFNIKFQVKADRNYLKNKINSNDQKHNRIQQRTIISNPPKPWGDNE